MVSIMSDSHAKNRHVSSGEIKAIRRTIDEVDQKILGLINRRLALAQKIGLFKQETGSRVLDRERETELLRNLLALNRNALLSDAALLDIFSRIILICRHIQQAKQSASRESEPPGLFAVIGNPLSHSLSPSMHTQAFRSVGYNGCYVAVEDADIGRALAGIRQLGFRGASITLPHKESSLIHLDELDRSAAEPGAVNTVVHRSGRLIGFNTDGIGALKALAEKTSLRGKTVGLIGAGGTARAIAFSMTAAGSRVVVLNRTRARGERLARDLGAEFRPLQELSLADCQIIVNATPVGMGPAVDQTPVPEEVLRPHMVVMDVVYRPLPTRFLREAEARGCVTVDGASMFVYQGAAQFELWTGLSAPLEIMRMTVRGALKDRSC